MNLPTGVASDGVHLAVADTFNNRVLIWNSLPTQNSQPASVVVGQTDFQRSPSSPTQPGTCASRRLVWQGRQFYVADTQNSRVLIWKSVPTQNNQPADVVRASRISPPSSKST